VTVTGRPVPQGALLQRYVGQGSTYVDCYGVEVAGAVSLSQFVMAFYTTRLFRLERVVLSLALRRRINDLDIADMLSGATGQFAVWTVEGRGPDELLLRDGGGYTRSWFGVRMSGPARTQLLFGSAVVARDGAALSVVARSSLPLHKIYSRALLQSAARDLGDSR
jgi:hypothetical protein